MYEGRGVYRHYKGGIYFVLGLALRENSVPHRDAFDGGITDVVYEPLDDNSYLSARHEQFWTRILWDFNAEVVMSDGSREPRFRKVNAYSVERYVSRCD